MDEYSYEIHIPNPVTGELVKHREGFINASDMDDAKNKVSRMARNEFDTYKILNVKFVKKFENPDNEI